MQTDLWGQFGALVSGPGRLLATVTAHNADGTSSVTTFEGAMTRVVGHIESASIPYNVWIVDGRVDAAAPNLPLSNLSV